MIILNFIRYQLRNFTKSFEILHIYYQIVIKAYIFWIVQKLEKYCCLFIRQYLNFLYFFGVFICWAQSICYIFLFFRFFGG